METKKVFSLGSIEYRQPDIIERLDLFGDLSLDPAVFAEGAKTGPQLKTLANILRIMRPFITKIDCKKGDEVIDTWDKAMNYMEFVNPLSEIAVGLLTSLNVEAAGTSEKAQKKKKH